MGMSEYFCGMDKAVGDGTTQVVDGAKNAVSQGMDGAKNSIKTSTSFVTDSTSNIPGVSQVTDMTKQGLSTVTDAANQVPGVSQAMDISKGAQGTVVGMTKKSMDFAMDGTKKVATGVTDSTKTISGTGMEFMKSGGDMMTSGAETFGTSMADGVAVIPGGSAVVDGAKSVTSPAMDATKKGMTTFYEGSDAVTAGFGDATSASTDMLESTTKFSLGNVTESFDTLGSVAGFQSLVGGMFGNVDKSDAGLEAMFKSMDADGSGKVSEEEMKAAILKVYGEGLKDEILKEMMKAADTNNDGEVDLDEFKTIMRAGPDSSA